jgi:hypothetical protein
MASKILPPSSDMKLPVNSTSAHFFDWESTVRRRIHHEVHEVLIPEENSPFPELLVLYVQAFLPLVPEMSAAKRMATQLYHLVFLNCSFLNFIPEVRRNDPPPKEVPETRAQTSAPFLTAFSNLTILPGVPEAPK